MSTAADKDRALAQRIKDTCLPALQPWFLAWPEKAANTLRRAQLTLHRWAEEECNGTIQRIEGPQGQYKDQTPFRWFQRHGNGDWYRDAKPCPDREAGALLRVAKVCKEAGLHFYHQTDPRGCALYVAAEPLTDQNYSSKGIACL